VLAATTVAFGRWLLPRFIETIPEESVLLSGGNDCCLMIPGVAVDETGSE
jgi:hypothetical protein